MDVIEALNSRHSVRAYKPEPVGKDTLSDIFAAAARTPSWANTQPWEIFVAGGEVLEKIRSDYAAAFLSGAPREPHLPMPTEWPYAMQQRMAELLGGRVKALGLEEDEESVTRAFAKLNQNLFGAPVVCYLCMDRSLTPWSIYDIGAFSQSLMLAAQQFGIASIPAFNLVAFPEILHRKLEIPEKLMILMGIALGYEDTGDRQNQYRSRRRSVEDMVKFKGI